MDVSIGTVPPSAPEAQSLLEGYYAELGERVTSARGMHAEWEEREYGRPRARVLVARIGDDAVGCAGLRPWGIGACEVKRLWVAKGARKQGVGRALLEALEGEAKDLGYRRMLLDTAAPLHEAAALYRSQGYEQVERFNDNPHATAWLAKDLPLDDRALWGAFSWSVLPTAEWNHRAHLRVAWLHLAKWELDEAHLLMRVGIIRLNEFHGLVETAARGYHETLTRAWLALVAASRRSSDAKTSEEHLERHAASLGKDAPLAHYSKELLESLRARAAWVEPDRTALP